MIHPSGLRRPDNLKSEVRQVRKGVFVVKNAYVGDYEYFRGKTLIKNAGKEIAAELRPEIKKQS